MLLPAPTSLDRPTRRDRRRLTADWLRAQVRDRHSANRRVAKEMAAETDRLQHNPETAMQLTAVGLAWLVDAFDVLALSRAMVPHAASTPTLALARTQLQLPIVIFVSIASAAVPAAANLAPVPRLRNRLNRCRIVCLQVYSSSL